MADSSPVPLESPSTSIPPHLAQDQSHAPVISSPLNPDQSAAKPKAPKAPAREQREKRETLKKREATAATRGDALQIPAKRKASGPHMSAPSPMRFSIPEPKLSDYDPPKETFFASHEPVPFLTPDGEVELKKPVDHAENKRGYRYSHCVADPQFRHKQYYRQTDTIPYGPRMSFEDTDKWIHYDTTGRYITNEKGWRMARANVCAREGSLYYEVRIVRGAPAEGPPVIPNVATPQPHVRMGWARREASLDAPVGFDGYSYGVTDIRFETMHRSRPGKFFHPNPKKSKSKGSATGKNEAVTVQMADSNIREGDVIGLEIQLPSLSLHEKVVKGIYNPAVDIGDGFDDEAPVKNIEPGTSDTYDVIRDRIPVPYKGNVYFETMDYVPSKPMEAYADRTLSVSSLSSGGAQASNSTIKTAPNTNHVEEALRTLPHSTVKVYKNGNLVGTAFENLLAFLPPASAPSKSAGAREGFDDGMVGYFPAVACFSGGIAEVNFGQDGFWMPPPHLRPTTATGTSEDVQMMNGGEVKVPTDPRWTPRRELRPIAERYKEQIAEDIVWDIIDEVDFFMRDGGFGGKVGAGAGGAKKGIASLKEEFD